VKQGGIEPLCAGAQTAEERRDLNIVESCDHLGNDPQSGPLPPAYAQPPFAGRRVSLKLRVAFTMISPRRVPSYSE
jgi:hypothetical protein